MTENIDMTEHQIYKWFWETNKRALNVESETIEMIKKNPSTTSKELTE